MDVTSPSFHCTCQLADLVQGASKFASQISVMDFCYDGLLPFRGMLCQKLRLTLSQTITIAALYTCK